MKLSPAMIEAVQDVLRRADAAPAGARTAFLAEQAARLKISLSTLQRYIIQVAVRPERKRRSDAGCCALSVDDAELLAAVLMQARRKNDKALLSIDGALLRCRANWPGFAEVVDAATGEISTISTSACIKALRTYGMHPDQLSRAAPAQQQASLHANHAWQIDASISTLYYVPDGRLADIDPAEVYKNKPEAQERVRRQLLTRYCITDHWSGSIFLHYVAGGESVVNLAECFLRCIQPREAAQHYGVPFHLMMDPGSAQIAGAFKNLLRRLQVRALVGKPRNPRQKGQVEKAHDLVEKDFESGFKFVDAPSIDWINDRAALWMRDYNSHRIHSRHGHSRWALWSEIEPQHLRLVDDDLARLLLTHEPQTPTVDQFLQVSFAGRRWSVEGLDGINRGDKIAVTYNPFDRSQAYLVEPGQEDGSEKLTPLPEVTATVGGKAKFASAAAVIGQEFKRPADTLLDANRKRIERLTMDAPTDAQAEAARKAKALPFGGHFEPYKHLADTPAPAWLQRRGTDMEPAVDVARAGPAPLPHFAAATRLVHEYGAAMTPELLSTLKGLHPDGVPDEPAVLRALAERLKVRGQLRVVGAGAAT